MSADTRAPAVFSFRSKTAVPAFGILVIGALAALFTSLGGLDVIAAFSSMTFLLVSIAVCVANLRLRKTTGSMVIPILLGLVLMSATVILLVYYLASHEPGALLFTAAVYAATVAAHLGFERLRKRTAR